DITIAIDAALSDNDFDGVSPQTVSVEILDNDVAKYEVTISINDGINPINEATLTIDGSNYLSDTNGEIVIELAQGVYDYTVEAIGYITVNNTLTVSDAAVFEIVSLSIEAQNNPPVAENDSLVVKFNVAGAGNLSENDFDPDGDELVYDYGLFTTAENGSLEIESTGEYTYIPATDFSGNDEYVYSVCDGSNECVTATLYIYVKTKDIVLYNAFSPNTNGTGYYIIPDLEDYPNNSLTILNRWGNVVYRAKPYNNTWSGKSNESHVFGGKLPEGTYFYIFNKGNGEEVFTGFIRLKQ
ncbi:MAG: gliding motility-associated C-terminal domain-containing protein, partial [Bacteroidales bacterium]|nr:gliding motility-associated C-terminal domain-containing protein [Bacteroidales bacterium]